MRIVRRAFISTCRARSCDIPSTSETSRSVRTSPPSRPWRISDHLGLALGQRPDGFDQGQLPLADLDAGVVVPAPLVWQQLRHLGAIFVGRPRGR